MPRDQEEKLNAVGFEWVRCKKKPNRDYSLTKRRKRDVEDAGLDRESANNYEQEEEIAADEFHDSTTQQQQQVQLDANEPHHYPNVNYMHPYFQDGHNGHQQHQFQRFWS